MCKVEQLNEFLRLFEESNSQSCGYKQYEFKYIGDKFEDNISSEMLKAMGINESNKVTLIPIEDWESELLNVLDKYWLMIKSKKIDLEGLKAEEFLVKLLKKFFYKSEIELIKIDVYPNKYHACASEEYILKANSKVYFLSFQGHS